MKMNLATLVDSYNKSVGSLFETTVGNFVKTVMGIVAAVLFLCLIIAVVMKIAGRQNRFVSMFCGGALQIIGLILLICILAGPALLFPSFMKLGDWLINASTDKTNELLNSVG